MTATFFRTKVKQHIAASHTLLVSRSGGWEGSPEEGNDPKRSLPNGTNNSRTFNPSEGSAEKTWGTNNHSTRRNACTPVVPLTGGGGIQIATTGAPRGEVTRGQLTAVVDSGLTADGAVCPARQVDDKKPTLGFGEVGGW